jgi:multiple sugar transport system ATP-binding protein
MPFVELDRVSKRYDGAKALAVEDVSLGVERGEFVVLLGPSGCGKSTILRMIAGLEPITSGTLAIDGRVINDVPAKDRDIAMVFQSYALYPHMAVRENLAFGLRRRGVAKAEIDARVRAVAETLGLAGLLDRKPASLSGGQRQRVALGRAIVREPKVFLFDEPLSNLDAALRSSTRGELIRLHQRLRATMIYVTHDQVEAMTMGQRICIVNDGRVVQVGAPLAVYHNPADVFVAGFLGTPPMNLFPATLEKGAGGLGARIAAGVIPLRGWVDAALAPFIGRAVTLGVRPEAVRLAPGVGDPTVVGLDATAMAIEPLGAETVVTVRLDGEPPVELALRTPGTAAAHIDERVAISIDPATVHVFDRATGHALPRERTST